MMLLKPRTGTKTVGDSAAERIAAARVPVRSITFIADPDNLSDVFLGDATTQPLQLTPGQSYSVGVDAAGENVDPYDFYAIGGAAGQVVNWLAVGYEFPER